MENGKWRIKVFQGRRARRRVQLISDFHSKHRYCCQTGTDNSKRWSLLTMGEARRMRLTKAITLMG